VGLVTEGTGNVGVLCVFGDGDWFVVGLGSVGGFGWSAWWEGLAQCWRLGFLKQLLCHRTGLQWSGSVDIRL